MALKASAVLAALAVVPSVALRTLLRSNETKDVSYGDSKCQCVGIGGLTGKLDVTFDDVVHKGLYPAEVGSSCQAWNDGRLPGCDGSLSQPGYCTEKWCYVDSCDCAIGTDNFPSTMFAGATHQGKHIYYSTGTCLDDVTYSDFETSECSKPWNEDKLGTEACPCVGIAGIKGTVDVMIDGVTYSDLYPAETGSSCEAWDDDRYPGSCDDPSTWKDWCGKKWCYVDPSNCVVDVGPFKSTKISNGTFQGSELYYSYETCKSAETND